MRNHNFPILVELEMIPKDGNEYEIVYSQVVNNYEALCRKIQYIKTLYNLDGTDYRINLVVQSVMNKYHIEK